MQYTLNDLQNVTIKHTGTKIGQTSELRIKHELGDSDDGDPLGGCLYSKKNGEEFHHVFLSLAKAAILYKSFNVRLVN